MTTRIVATSLDERNPPFRVDAHLSFNDGAGGQPWRVCLNDFYTGSVLWDTMTVAGQVRWGAQISVSSFLVDPSPPL